MTFFGSVFIAFLIWTFVDDRRLKKRDFTPDRMVVCEDCKTVISPSAKTCPTCGAVTLKGKVSRNSTIMFIVLGIYIVIKILPYIILQVSFGPA